MPCHHALAEALCAYIDAAGIGEDRKGFLFRTSPGHNATVLTEEPMMQADAWRMIRRRAVAVGIRYSAEIAGHMHLPKISEDFMSGVRSGVNGTPTFFINGVRHDGGWDYNALIMALQRAAVVSAAA
jgi:hypothetical protein